MSSSSLVCRGTLIHRRPATPVVIRPRLWRPTKMKRCGAARVDRPSQSFRSEYGIRAVLFLVQRRDGQYNGYL